MKRHLLIKCHIDFYKYFHLYVWLRSINDDDDNNNNDDNNNDDDGDDDDDDDIPLSTLYFIHTLSIGMLGKLSTIPG